MKQNKYLLNTLLAIVLFLTFAVLLVVQTVAPAVDLPKLDIPNLVLLSMVALVVEHLIAPRAPRNYIWVLILSLVTFALLPLVAGMTTLQEFWKVGLSGGAVFTVCTFLFSSVTDRLSTGPKARAAVVVCAFGIYLAAQCFAGMIL